MSTIRNGKTKTFGVLTSGGEGLVLESNKFDNVPLKGRFTWNYWIL